MKNDPFQAAKLCLDTAKRHIDQFLIGANLFLGNPKNDANVIDDESQPGQHLYKIRFAGPVPYEMNSIAFDAVTNIRDALDNTVYASIAASGTKIRRLKKIKFPFGDTTDQVLNEITSNVDLHPAIADLLRDFKPEARRDNPLWTINQLANSKKHRWNLTPFPVFAGNVKFHFVAMHGPGGFSPAFDWDGSKNELTYLRMEGKMRANFNATVTFDISFDEPAEIRHTSALSVLRAFRNEAQRVLVTIEAESRRLGWII